MSKSYSKKRRLHMNYWL